MVQFFFLIWRHIFRPSRPESSVPSSCRREHSSWICTLKNSSGHGTESYECSAVLNNCNSGAYIIFNNNIPPDNLYRHAHIHVYIYTPLEIPFVNFNTVLTVFFTPNRHGCSMLAAYTCIYHYFPVCVYVYVCAMCI